jgi:acetyl-CoA/propionyl-CoA carboxylase biotin carboxyl carrier protein
MRRALAETRVLGVRTNLAYLRWLFDQPAMREGQLRTDTIDGLELPATPVPAPEDWAAAAAGAVTGGLLPSDVWGGGWRANAPAAVRLRHEQDERRIELPAASASLPHDGVAVDHQAGTVHVDVGGQSLAFAVADAPTVDEAVRHAATPVEGHAALMAPMPGRVVAVRAAAGARVEAHATLVVVEAMKMEHAVTTPIAGAVQRVAVREGDQVQRGDLLAEVVARPDLESRP